MWRERKKGPVHVVEPVRVDGRWTPEAACAALEGVIATDPGGRWAVDAARLHPIGSEPLAALINAARTAHAAGGRLTLYAAPPGLARVLQATRTGRFLPVHADLTTALAALGD
jgi:anti-anti-sigma regulatory factor